MERINLNTGSDGFLLVDSIIKAENRCITGVKTFTNASIYLGLEALAQLGAFHVRFLTRFERHSFLLKITRCLMPAMGELNGRYELSGKLVSQSSSAFSHILQAKKGGNVQIEGQFLFATVNYDQKFRKEMLQQHYRSIFSCLKNA